jgi:hypothetical protein
MTGAGVAVASDFGEPEEGLLQSYYQVVGDIQGSGDSSRNARPDGLGFDWEGLYLPGTNIWIGVDPRVAEARTEGKLSQLLSSPASPAAFAHEGDNYILGSDGLLLVLDAGFDLA